MVRVLISALFFSPVVAEWVEFVAEVCSGFGCRLFLVVLVVFEVKGDEGWSTGLFQWGFGHWLGQLDAGSDSFGVVMDVDFKDRGLGGGLSLGLLSCDGELAGARYEVKMEMSVVVLGNSGWKGNGY
ncbi:hypothetical protein V6N11_082407 [Hibiscus sabdariffa]